MNKYFEFLYFKEIVGLYILASFIVIGLLYIAFIWLYPYIKSRIRKIKEKKINKNKKENDLEEE